MSRNIRGYVKIVRIYVTPRERRVSRNACGEEYGAIKGSRLARGV